MKTVIHNHNTFINGAHAENFTTMEVVVAKDPYVPPPGPETPFGIEVGDVGSFYRLVVPCLLCGRRVRAVSMLKRWEGAASVLDAEHMVTKGGGPGRLFNERMLLWDKIARIVDPLSRKKAVETVVWFFSKMQERSVDVARACEAAIEKAESLL